VIDAALPAEGADDSAPSAGPRSPTGGAVHPAISLHGLTKSFTETGPVVLDRIDLTVAPGEFVSLVGASGCGKSTLLSCIAELERPTAGTILTSGPPALMFQEPALMPWLTARRNVELPLLFAGRPRAQRRRTAEELLAMVNLDGAADLRPHQLSGGMRQRVAIARALAQQREILLMDEPFAALDAITRDVLHEELERIWRQTGLSILFVTHNVREAVRLSDRVILMSSRPGRLIRHWSIDLPRPRVLDSTGVATQAALITEALREEISRHAA